MDRKCRMIVVTGANGFVGRNLVGYLKAREFDVRPVARAYSPADSARVATADLLDPAPWPAILDHADALVHLAAHNPTRGSRASFEHALFERVNVEATRQLAEAARKAGVLRFVFVSSARVYGAGRDMALREDDALSPSDLGRDAYAVSKRRAEEVLLADLAGSAMTVSIFRPPMIYGRGRGGVFGTFVRAMRAGIPLPFEALAARRSLLHVDNLASAIEAAIIGPSTQSGLFNIADAEALTHAQLLRAIGEAVGRPARLFAVPDPVWRMAGHVPRIGPALSHATAPLILDTGALRSATGWTPPLSTRDGLRMSV